MLYSKPTAMALVSFIQVMINTNTYLQFDDTVSRTSEIISVVKSGAYFPQV